MNRYLTRGVTALLLAGIVRTLLAPPETRESAPARDVPGAPDPPTAPDELVAAAPPLSRIGRKRRVASRALTILVVAVAAVWAIFFRPPLLGGDTNYIVVSGNSMLPTLHNGDLVLARSHPTYSKGDILAYAVPKGEPGAGVLVIHRVVGGDERNGYVLQGDNRDGIDPWRPRGHEIRGSTLFSVPRLGLLLALVATPLGLALLAAVVVFLAVFPQKDDEPEKDEPAEPVGRFIPWTRS